LTRRLIMDLVCIVISRASIAWFRLIHEAARGRNSRHHSKTQR